jgi:hypothetical protein
MDHPTIKLAYIFLFSFLLFQFSTSPLKAQSDSTRTNKSESRIDPNDPEHVLFSSDDPMSVTLAFDIKEFIKNRYDPRYEDADITLHFNKEDSLVQHIKLKPSGIFRRTYCFYPPMHLNFKKTELLGNEPAEQHVMKLVAHCKNERIYTVYILREYLAYRLYNIISPYSLKVRLLNIAYQDTQNQKKRFNRYGFLVENAYNMAERTHSILEKDIKNYRENLLLDEATRVGIFQYMIGNTDWAAPLLHNIKLLQLANGRRIYVPYDFDYSGFVGTDYAIPAPALGITDVKERLYIGYCASDEMFMKAINDIESHKAEFYSLIENFDLLTKREKKYLLTYLDDFFVMMKDKPVLIQKLRMRCG